METKLAVPDHVESDKPAKALFEELAKIIKANPLQGYNHPALPKRHQKQLDFNAIQSPALGTKALIAGSRSGKTVACVVDDIIQAVPDECVPPHLKAFKKWQPPFHVWIGAPKYKKHDDTILPLLRKFIPKSQLIEGSFDKSYKYQKQLLTLVCGSTFGFKTYDQDKDAWASAEVHRIHWDEEPNGDFGRELRYEARARLISTDGDEIISMTPLLGYSWVHDEVWEVRHSDPKIKVVQMGMADNPWNSPATVAEYASKLSEEEKRMRLHGEFVHLGGMFFEEFRERLHVVDPIRPKHLEGQSIVVGIDPGRNRTGVVWIAFDKDNSALVFDEFNPKLAVVPDVAAEIKRKNKEWGLRAEDVTYVIDPSSRNTSAINADQVEAAYSREEIYCQWGQNSRAAGILEMKRRLQEKGADARPHPTLLFTRDCPQTIEQAERYRRDPKSNDEWAAVPQTDQTRFDLVDATRYGVMSRTWELPYEDPYQTPAYQPNFQEPYSEERKHFQSEPAPMGEFS